MQTSWSTVVSLRSKMKQTREYLSVLLIFSDEGKNLAHLKRKNKQGTAGLVWQVFKAVTTVAVGVSGYQISSVSYTHR